ncbi:hypothetical protein ACG74X_04740 [Marivita sp. S0852]|uniref:hypothetical protein n=1 Tax=Marivita sp. S0852 TaxID=3373893 RepID=UPI0039829109
MTLRYAATAALIAALTTGAQANSDQIDQIRADLSSKGFTDIDIDIRGDRIIADADKGRRDFEVIYDRNTGSIISQGWEDERDASDIRGPAVEAAYADLATRGLTDIDLDVKGDRIFADGELRGRDYEVVYDRASGEVVSEGWEVDDSVRPEHSDLRDAAIADLAARGFTDIDVDQEGDRLVAEGELNGRDYEAVYDTASGQVVSEGFDTDRDEDRDEQDDREDDDDHDDDDDRDDDHDSDDDDDQNDDDD